jgi:hypothetical protein
MGMGEEKTPQKLLQIVWNHFSDVPSSQDPSSFATFTIMLGLSIKSNDGID